MSKLTHIVAATDLSAASRHATDRAALLSRMHDVPLTVVHSISSGMLDELRGWAGAATDAQAVEDDARKRLGSLGEDLRQRHGARVTDELVVGHPVIEVTRIAEQREADLLVTGTRGTSFVRGVVIGSTAERIAKRSRRPVLMVRQSVREPYRRVLVPVDFSPWSLEAVRLAGRVAPGAALVLMHAVSVPFEGRMRLSGVPDSSIARYRELGRIDAMGKLQALADQAGLPPERVRHSTPLGSDPWMLIAEEEQEHDCDLIVIGRQGRHALDELLLGSTTRMVLAECSGDVLVSIVRDDARA